MIVRQQPGGGGESPRGHMNRTGSRRIYEEPGLCPGSVTGHRLRGRLVLGFFFRRLDHPVADKPGQSTVVKRA